MQVQLKHQPSDTLAICRLNPQESIKVEPGALVGYSEDITIETKAQGGLLGGLKRMIAQENFFQNMVSAGREGGEVLLSPVLPGDINIVDIQDQAFYLQSGTYLASDEGVEFDTRWGGSRGFFGSGSLLLLQVTGRGQVLASCYGAMEEKVLANDEVYTIDTGHVVGFDASIKFEVRRVGGWKATFLSGEGLVVRLKGPGRVLVQTRSEASFLNWLIPQLPTPPTPPTLSS